MTTVRLAFGGGRVETSGLQNPDLKPAMLVSYWYKKGFEKARDQISYRDWVLDSGAFSAKHAGAQIDIKEFTEYCKQIKKEDPLLTEIYALDVIGNNDMQSAKDSIKNAEYMWSEGVEAIPCYHKGEPLSALDHIAKNYPKIAVGGLTIVAGSKAKINWARMVMERVWPKKVHGFGCGSETVILSVPFHSVDATSWSIRPQRFGQWQSMDIDAAKSLPLYTSDKHLHKLEMEVAWYLELEKRAQFRWKREMELLETL